MEKARFLNLLQKNNDFTAAAKQLWTGTSITIDKAFVDLQNLGSCALTIAGIAKTSTTDAPLLVIVPKKEQAERLASDIRLFWDGETLLLPVNNREEEQIDTATFQSSRFYAERIHVLKHVLDKENSQKSNAKKRQKDNAGDHKTPVIIAALEAVNQPVPSRNFLSQCYSTFSVGDTIDIEELRLSLVKAGYHGTSAVDLPGEFALRGCILDIFAYEWQNPVRLEFFGEEIESIRSFDVPTQRSLENLRTFFFVCRISRESGTSTVWDYLSQKSPVVLVDPETLQRTEHEHEERQGTEMQVAMFSQVLQKLFPRPTASLATLSQGIDEVHVQMPFGSVERFQGTLETVCRELERCDTEEIAVFCDEPSDKEKLHHLFSALKPVQEKRLHFLDGNLSAGFSMHDGKTDSRLLVLSSAQLFNRNKTYRPKPRVLGQVIDSFLDLKPGDHVVHIAHGIACFRGMETITKGSQDEEHLRLEFAENQVLFVPVSKIGLVQKYVAGGKVRPRLAKIGSTLWSRHKQTVQEAVFDLAEEMLEIQAARESQPGVAFPSDSDWQREFEAGFPFQETHDQLLAIEAVKQDMERARPMDRLICGDVGFGKTEIAIRAAFKAVDAGYQVAILVPTTILAEQHARSFCERMHNFPIQVSVLSRFQTDGEQKSIVAGLADGKVDIVIGTHRIVSSDISFQKLGLVVIDEEQRFGVKHKERLKSFRETVDVLTMTATPIPRTLHFSLLGIREISNLETPPENRLAVETKLLRFDENVIRHAVLREIQRGGQIYFVHNRVHDIDELARRIQHIVPECRIGVGHAQMADEELETVMNSFVRHEFDLLLCTTIIESGLDIPNANTMFIDEANRYGLADLHQLRGRVGRSTKQAYCYLLLAKNQLLTSQAAKRLRAIEEYAHLGSGFHLAMRDLEIRGAGNILGTQQSGHIAAVGYEMYCQFLETAVRALKQLPPKTVIDVELDLPGLAQIPSDYVNDQRFKIDLYRRLTRIGSLEERRDLAAEIRDRFGPFPAEVQRLLTHADIRVLAHHFRIRSVTFQPGIGLRERGFVVFRYVSQPLMDQLAEKLKKQRQAIRFTADQQAFVPLPDHLSYSSPADAVLEFVVSVLSS